MADVIVEQEVDPKILVELSEHFGVMESGGIAELDVSSNGKKYLRLWCDLERYQKAKGEDHDER